MWMKYHLRVCSSSASCCRNPGFGRTFRANDMNVGSECRFSNMALTFILRKFFDTYLSSLGDHIQGLSEYAITDEGKEKNKKVCKCFVFLLKSILQCNHYTNQARWRYSHLFASHVLLHHEVGNDHCGRPELQYEDYYENIYFNFKLGSRKTLH